MEVLHGRETVQEHLVRLARGLQLCTDILFRAQWSPQHADTANFRRIIMVAKPNLGMRIVDSSGLKQYFVAVWGEAASVPELGLPLVHTDATAEDAVDHANAFGLGDNVDVVQESEQTLVSREFGLHGQEGLMLAQRVEHGHHGVALLAAFTLEDLVNVAQIILPQVRRGVAVELNDEEAPNHRQELNGDL